VIHGTDQVGRSKVASAADAVRLLNPQVTVEQHPVRLEPGNALELLSGYHLVLDGTDTFPTRYLVSDACELLGLPCVWGSVFRFDGQVSVFWAAAPPDAAGEPRGVTYRDLHPEPPPDGSVPSCAEAGVLGVICAAVGSVMAAEAIKLICGIGEPLLGRLMVLDGLRMSWRTVSVRAVPGRAAVTGLARPDGERLPSPGSSSLAGTITAAELCALITARGDVRADVVLVDVRSLQERDVVAIPGSVHVPLDRFRADADAALSEVAGPDVLVVLHCKTGSRSAEALALARAAGYGRAVHLAGGVLAWIDEADPSLPRY
jgi:adenylyltransferase/sulfurtransferase